MSEQEYQIPNLVSVLQTLASLTPRDQQAHFPRAEAVSDVARIPNAPLVSTPVPAPKLVDPATIVDWSSGLRCVMKTVAARENIIGEIRRMIKVQHEHEEQWWNGRQALLKRQEARIEGQKTLDNVLRAVGGVITKGNDDNEGELKTFDVKVYRAQVQMVKEMSAKLKSFGVPFFGTRNDLIQRPGETIPERWKITEAELVELQRKMILMLEDLCKE